VDNHGGVLWADSGSDAVSFCHFKHNMKVENDNPQAHTSEIMNCWTRQGCTVSLSFLCFDFASQEELDGMVE
jgi:hypothetical protein